MIYKFIKFFNEISQADTAVVGGKNASLGEMYQKLTSQGVKVPFGFAVSAAAYDYFIKVNNLQSKIEESLNSLDVNNLQDLQVRGEAIRNLIRGGNLSPDLEREIAAANLQLQQFYQQKIAVAVRSSATFEDHETASFAGEQESYLNIETEIALMTAIKNCFASLFTDRSLAYRKTKGFSNFKIKLSVGVQKMVRADLASSGVLFTLEPDTGLRRVIVINSLFGLGEAVARGKVIPDEFVVFKDGLVRGKKSIIEKKIGEKLKKTIYATKQSVDDNLEAIASKRGTVDVATSELEQRSFSITDEEALRLANSGLMIERHYGLTMDIEWAKDGEDGELYILQARPETVFASKKENIFIESRLKEKSAPILQGVAIGDTIASGKVRLIKNQNEMNEFRKGEILVTEVIDPDLGPILAKAAGIVATKGAKTAHTAIIARELNIPAVVGVKEAMTTLRAGQEVTIDCSAGSVGTVYAGWLEAQKIRHDLSAIPKTKTNILITIESPDEAQEKHYLPVGGVGLAKSELILIGIGIHPNALLTYNSLPEELKSKLDRLLKANGAKQFYLQILAEGIAKVAVSFYPNPVIVRLSNFDAGQWGNLVGGELDQVEAGLRGVLRYSQPQFQNAFALEMEAIARTITEWGLDNVSIAVPVAKQRAAHTSLETLTTATEAILKIIERIIARGSTKIYLLPEFQLELEKIEILTKDFDGIIIDVQELSQPFLGYDIEQELISKTAAENDATVQVKLKRLQELSRSQGKFFEICVDNPSDNFLEFAVGAGVQSLSVSPSAALPTIVKVAKIENRS